MEPAGGRGIYHYSTAPGLTLKYPSKRLLMIETVHHVVYIYIYLICVQYYQSSYTFGIRGLYKVTQIFQKALIKEDT